MGQDGQHFDLRGTQGVQVGDHNVQFIVVPSMPAVAGGLPQALPPDCAEPPGVHGSGAAEQGRKAELDAVAAYKARLAGRDGVLEFSLLAEHVPPMTYRPLADSFQVSVAGQGQSGKGFLVMARRWPRMLLTGLPGMGKSTALEQAAARWAVDPRAPVPVLVPLREIGKRSPRRGADITLAVLVEAATDGAPEHERAALRRALESAVRSGEAVLLLDGLDECGDRRGVLADGIAEVLSGLPLSTGVVLAARESALPAARKLGLPEAGLTEPQWLDSAIQRLLRHAAASARVPAGAQDRWVRERAAQLDTVRRGHPDLWAVPLLATLITLLVAARTGASLPASRALLLLEAVQGTAEKWEISRLREAGRNPVAREELLNDGYGEIAHAVTASVGACRADAALQKVKVMLAGRWGLAPGEAVAAAREVMEFWDTRAGVFLASTAGDLTPRSRVFAEIGVATWAIRQDSYIQREWIAECLRDDDRREPVVLAAALSPEIACELVDAAACAADPGQRSRAQLWATDSVMGGAELPDRSLRAVISLIARAAGGADREAPDGEPAGQATVPKRPRWGYAVRLAGLPLPGTLRAERDAALAGLAPGEYERLLAGALTALADARADSRSELSPDQAASVSRLLARPLPVRDNPAVPAPPPGARPGYRPPRRRLLPGHQQAAEQAALYARQLGPDATRAIYRIARSGAVADYFRVADRLTALGYPDPEPFRSSTDMAGLAERIRVTWDEWKVFLAAAASIAEPRPLTVAERWRYPHLASLADTLEAGEATLDDIYALDTHNALLPGWIKAAAKAADLELPAISAQARAALEAWQAGNQDVIDVMFAPPPSPPPLFSAARLGEDDVDTLFEALASDSGWLSGTACAILSTAGDPAIGQRAADQAARVPTYLRSNVVIVAVANHPSPLVAATQLLDGGDPPLRVGAAAAALLLSSTAAAGAWQPVLDRARADRDMTVRLAAGTDRETAGKADYWSCQACGKTNQAAAEQCTSCPDGARLGVRVVNVATP